MMTALSPWKIPVLTLFLLGMPLINEAAIPDESTQESDSAALNLADQTPEEKHELRPSTFSLEATFGQTTYKEGTQLAERLSLAETHQWALNPNWQAFISNRLDIFWKNHGSTTNLSSSQDTINTLREAYLSWQPDPARTLDIGRIQLRNGVAYGYNPTDFFKDHAVRALISVDPNSLKENRLGTFALQGKYLWENSAVSMAFSPRINTAPSRAPFNIDAGSTNAKHRALIKINHRMNDRLTPQWLIYTEAGQTPQLGFNLNYLLNDATLLYVEWAGGKNNAYIEQALSQYSKASRTFKQRTASGITYTAPNKLSLTVEYQYDGLAPSRTEWDQFRNTSMLTPQDYSQYRDWALASQTLVTRDAAFFHASIKDLFMPHLDLTSFVRLNLQDHSRMNWFEARYRGKQQDFSFQWQKHQGQFLSEFGAIPEKTLIKLLITHYF